MTHAEPGGQNGLVAEKLWPPAPQTVGRARRFLVRQLSLWDLKQLTDTAELIVSELVTNAITHTYPPYGHLIATRLERLDSGIRIEVHDAGTALPERRRAGEDEESGRGLCLVDSLTGGQWGVSCRSGPGKAVWALCTEPGAGA
ncbi:ATP-binding protein [Streptomyces sp. NPDC020983]|uniref:ATP-binding protein n=1 Tax=Streptomyces sp. NPDC020983 TaxID=3365106 RepID=UPI003798AEBA